MKKLYCILVALSLLLVSTVSVALAEPGIMPLANPNTNVDDPRSLPYSSSFNFAEYVTTYSIKAPSDGSVTVTLSDTALAIDREDVTCSVRAYYWNGSTWKSASVSPSSCKVSGTEGTYSFSVSGLPSGSSFYVRLSKTEYTDYKLSGTISVTD